MFRTSTLVIIMDLLNVMTIINYRPLYCLFASKFYAFGIPSRQFLALPLYVGRLALALAATTTLDTMHRHMRQRFIRVLLGPRSLCKFFESDE